MPLEFSQAKFRAATNGHKSVRACDQIVANALTQGLIDQATKDKYDVAGMTEKQDIAFRIVSEMHAAMLRELQANQIRWSHQQSLLVQPQFQAQLTKFRVWYRIEHLMAHFLSHLHKLLLRFAEILCFYTENHRERHHCRIGVTEVRRRDGTVTVSWARHGTFYTKKIKPKASKPSPPPSPPA